MNLHNEIRGEIEKHLETKMEDWFVHEGTAAGYYPNGVHLRMHHVEGRVVELRGLTRVSLPLVGDWQSLIPHVIDATGGNLPHIPRAMNGLLIALEDGLEAVPHLPADFIMSHLYPAIGARKGTVLKVGSVVFVHTPYSNMACDHAVAHGFDFDDDPTSSYLVASARGGRDPQALQNALVSQARLAQKALAAQHHILFVNADAFDGVAASDKQFSVAKNKVVTEDEAGGDGVVDAALLADYLTRLNTNRVLHTPHHVILISEAGFAVMTRQYK